MTAPPACQELLLDIRGQICPSSLLTALREINQRRHDLRTGQCRIVVLSDHRDATVTIPEMVHNMGYQVQVARESGYYRIEIDQG
ncbi:MAG: tRNA methyltransferase [Desulfobulbaceae bacterium A2]|nr:MAG: tRNA methyltransferase [Desulfobulbaceae bacterium A2]